jgi:hypothetical protein
MLPAKNTMPQKRLIIGVVCEAAFIVVKCAFVA